MIEIIPAIDIINGRCVRLTGGDYSMKKEYSDDPVAVAREFEQMGFSRLHVVDLDGAVAGKPVNLGLIREICRAVSMKVDVGGGIRSRSDAAMVIDAGAAQFTAGSIAVSNRELVLQWLAEFGPERVILGADVKSGMIAVSGWRETAPVDVFEFIGSYLAGGLRTVICTDVSRDGMMGGPATDLYREIIARFPDIELIASGGVSSAADLAGLEDAGIRSVIVGKALYEKGSGFRVQGSGLPSATPLVSSPSARCRAQGFATQAPLHSSVRIIPCLDVKDGRVVKGTNFEGLRDAGDPVELAYRYSREGADELVFLDISATGEGRKTMAGMVRRVAGAINIPFTVGGGISSVEDVNVLLSNGADKVSINSAAVRRPELIPELAGKFGSQCIVLAVDTGRQPDGSWKVFVNGGKVATGIDLFEWVEQAIRSGAGEVLFTSIDNDGTGKGFAVEALSEIVSRVNVPVIASGGAGKPEHFLEAVTKGRAHALLAAGLFHYGKLTIPALKKYLNDKGVTVRV